MTEDYDPPLWFILTRNAAVIAVLAWAFGYVDDAQSAARFGIIGALTLLGTALALMVAWVFLVWLWKS